MYDASFPILECPLLHDKNYPPVLIPAYFLSNGFPDLIRETAVAVEVPISINNRVRELNREGEIPGWTPLFLMACGAHLCSRCIPGISWGKGPNVYIVPTRIIPESITVSDQEP
jgi:hypothetical protein